MGTDDNLGNGQMPGNPQNNPPQNPDFHSTVNNGQNPSFGQNNGSQPTEVFPQTNGNGQTFGSQQNQNYSQPEYAQTQQFPPADGYSGAQSGNQFPPGHQQSGLYQTQPQYQPQSGQYPPNQSGYAGYGQFPNQPGYSGYGQYPNQAPRKKTGWIWAVVAGVVVIGLVVGLFIWQPWKDEDSNSSNSDNSATPTATMPSTTQTDPPAPSPTFDPTGGDTTSPGGGLTGRVVKPGTNDNPTGGGGNPSGSTFQTSDGRYTVKVSGDITDWYQNKDIVTPGTTLELMHMSTITTIMIETEPWQGGGPLSEQTLQTHIESKEPLASAVGSGISVKVNGQPGLSYTSDLILYEAFVYLDVTNGKATVLNIIGTDKADVEKVATMIEVNGG